MIATSIMTSQQRRTRANIRNFLLVATRAELARELEISLESGDRFKTECIRELIEEYGR